MRKTIIITLILVMITTPVLAFEKDKNQHFAAGAITYSIADLMKIDKPMLTVIAVGIGKELYDSQTDGTVEIKDALATILGGMLAQFTIRW